MKVYILKDIPGSAKAGEVKEVSNGYFRNFLAPKKLAVPATGRIVRHAAIHAKAVERHAQQDASRLATLVRALDGFEIVVHANASSEGTLFGSVTIPIIVEALKKAGYAISPQWVQLEHSIKKLGKFPVELRLSQGKKAMVMVEVISA